MNDQGLHGSINQIMAELEHMPEKRKQLQAQLREKIALLEGQGKAAPEQALRYSVAYPDQAEDFFDNMPV